MTTVKVHGGAFHQIAPGEASEEVAKKYLRPPDEQILNETIAGSIMFAGDGLAAERLLIRNHSCLTSCQASGKFTGRRSGL
ncbi:hypothetical protein DJICPGNB_19190 [Escherichia coli]|nr:hypothetical protein DJICPGNB_19190 [Escherichia coli]